MANPRHVKLATSGPDAVDNWRENNPETQLDLEGADLTGVNLAGTKIRDANLKGANLRYATGLTTEQINSALIDKNTLLPNYLKIEWKSETEFKCHVSQQKRT